MYDLSLKNIQNGGLLYCIALFIPDGIVQPVPERGRHGIGLINPGDREVDVMTPSTSDPLVAAEAKKKSKLLFLPDQSTSMSVI